MTLSLFNVATSLIQYLRLHCLVSHLHLSLFYPKLRKLAFFINILADQNSSPQKGRDQVFFPCLRRIFVSSFFKFPCNLIPFFQLLSGFFVISQFALTNIWFPCCLAVWLCWGNSSYIAEVLVIKKRIICTICFEDPQYSCRTLFWDLHIFIVINLFILWRIIYAK